MMLSLEMLAGASLIFVLRVLNYSVSTIRLVFIARNRRWAAAFMAFWEAFLFAVVMAGVVSNLSNLPNLFAYCFGAAVGSYVGMALEGRFVKSFSTVQIIGRRDAGEMAANLRAHGWGVTETTGRGKDGEVIILRSTISNHDLPVLLDVVRSINPACFIDVEPARPILNGWIPHNGESRRA